jgi:molybdopterin-biosynthesis enzyme MoeA-like protein
MTNILSAKELMAKIAKVEGEKASKAMKAHEAAEAEKQELLDRLSKPSGLSDDEVMEKAAIIVNRAVENGMTSVQVFRFPNHVCTDNGRAINQVEDGWEQTLTGVPKEIYDFWQRQLKPRGYHMRFEIIDYPGGMPGDVGIFLSWR